MFITTNAADLHEELNAHRESIQDTRTLMKQLAGVMEEAVNYNFDSEGRGEWAALSDVTKARRQKGGKILQDNRLLSGSVVARHTAEEAIAGTTDIRAATHQFGAKQGEFGTTSRGAPIPWGDIPARPFFELRDDDIEEMMELVDNYFEV